MTDPHYHATYYRQQAEDARQSAARALNEEYRASYLKLAADWDWLAENVQASNQLRLAETTSGVPAATK